MDRYDALAMLGVVCASIGMGLIYLPLGLVVFGVCLIGGALVGARSSATMGPSTPLRSAQDDEEA